MKKIIYTLSLLSMLTACNRVSGEGSGSKEENKKDTVLSAKNTEEEITEEKPTRASLEKYFTNDGNWIQVRNALSSDRTGLYIYFQAPDDVARNLRMRIQYSASTYKFIIDGKQYTYKANRSQNNNDSRFVESASITWYDDGVKKDDLKFLEALASSQKAELNIGGSIITIDDQIKKNIRRTLNYFESMDGLLPKTNMVNIRRL